MSLVIAKKILFKQKKSTSYEKKKDYKPTVDLGVIEYIPQKSITDILHQFSYFPDAKGQ